MIQIIQGGGRRCLAKIKCTEVAKWREIIKRGPLMIDMAYCDEHKPKPATKPLHNPKLDEFGGEK